MSPPRRLQPLLLILLLLATPSSCASTTPSSSSTTPPPPTTQTAPPTSIQSTSTMPNRITYQNLPPCASSCVAQAIPSIPATPFVAKSFCGLPTGRYAYLLPQECVESQCGGKDRTAEESWRKSVCSGVRTVEGLARRQAGASATSSPSSSGPVTSSSPTTEEPAPAATSTPKQQGVCESGHTPCPAGLNGGCCPDGFACNLYDCEPPQSKNRNTFDISTFFPPCAHECIASFLPYTQCSLTPLNTTCFCRLHDFIQCLNPSLCSTTDSQEFTKRHMELCSDQWYYTPFAKQFDRWCDLSGSKFPPGGDVRSIPDALRGECANFWKVRNGGKRFGIVLGFMIATVLLLWGCCGFWFHVAKSGDAREDRKRREKEANPWSGIPL